MFKSKIIKGTDAALYSMPCLDGNETADPVEDLEERQRKAYEEGFAAGEKAGFAAGEQKAGVLIERLENIIREITGLKEDMYGDVETQVIDLSIAIARRIIIEEIHTRPEFIVALVREALKKLQRTGTITIKINPALQEIFNRRGSELTEIHPEIVFDINPSVAVTGPLVISDTEEVVTDLDSLLANIIQDLNIKERPLKSICGEIEEEGKQDAGD